MTPAHTPLLPAAPQNHPRQGPRVPVPGASSDTAYLTPLERWVHSRLYGAGVRGFGRGPELRARRLSDRCTFLPVVRLQRFRGVDGGPYSLRAGQLETPEIPGSVLPFRALVSKVGVGGVPLSVRSRRPPACDACVQRQGSSRLVCALVPPQHQNTWNVVSFRFQHSAAAAQDSAVSRLAAADVPSGIGGSTRMAPLPVLLSPAAPAQLHL